MLSPKLASRYAKSLLEISKERKVESDVFEDMSMMHEVLDRSDDLKMLFKSPVIPTEKKEKVIKTLFEKKISKVSYGFIELLVKKGRERFIDEIVASFIELYNKENEIISAELITAVEVDKSTIEAIQTLIKTQAKVKDIKLITKVDPNIVGGFVLKYNNLLFDDSIEHKLQRIKNTINDSSYISKL